MKEFELEPGEEVVRESRKHWFIFSLELLPYAILAVLPFAIPNFLRLSTATLPFAHYAENSNGIARAAYGLWLLIIWTGAWGVFTRYYLNAWILTNQRIVEIKQRGFFNREVSSVLLARVQDVTTSVYGLLPSLLDIGNITVQSAGAVDEFHMNGIGRPEEMRDIILKFVATKGQNTAL